MSTQTKSYFGCFVKQRSSATSPEFFAFYAPVKDISNWAEVKATGQSPKGTQRILRESRKRGITRYLNADKDNTVPNNMLVAFPDGIANFVPMEERLPGCEMTLTMGNDCDDRLKWGFLEFPVQAGVKPALIVDGQHRLAGMKEFLPEDLPILVVALVDANIQEQAFQFIVINSKAVRVPTENAKSIITGINEQQLRDRLLKSGVPYGEATPVLRDINDLVNSPFYRLLDWSHNREGLKLVPLTAIEQSLRYLEKVYPTLKEDEDSLVEVFCAIWRAVKQTFPSLWGQENNFMTKVSINALNEFLIDRLKFAEQMDLLDSIYEVEDVEKYIATALKRIAAAFWEGEWSIRIQDNANVRNLIKVDLNQMVDNLKAGRHWQDDLVLPLIPKSQEEQEE